MERYNITVKDNPFDGCPYADMVVSDDGAYMRYDDAQRALDALQAQLARWKEALGEWLWNCTNLLGDYHIKTVQDFNEEVNRRIAWLMQHLDHTLPPPMTDEERDRMRKLSEVNDAQRALDAEREKAKQLDRTLADVYQQRDGLQAQLRQVEGERDAADAELHRDMVEYCQFAHEIALPGTRLPEQVDDSISFGKLKDVVNAIVASRDTLRQLVEALPVVDGRMDVECGACYYIRSFVAGQYGVVCGLITEPSTAMAIKTLLEYRATLAAKDAPHPTEEQS